MKSVNARRAAVLRRLDQRVVKQLLGERKKDPRDATDLRAILRFRRLR